MTRISMLGSPSKTALSVRDWYRILSRASLEFEMSSRRKIWRRGGKRAREAPARNKDEKQADEYGMVSFAKKTFQSCNGAEPSPLPALIPHQLLVGGTAGRVVFAQGGGGTHQRTRSACLCLIRIGENTRERPRFLATTTPVNFLFISLPQKKTLPTTTSTPHRLRRPRTKHTLSDQTSETRGRKPMYLSAICLKSGGRFRPRT